MTSGVPISGVERCDQCRREGQVCAFEVLICLHEILAQLSFLLIEDEETLSGQRWGEEEGQRPRRDLVIAKGEERYNGGVERQGSQEEWSEHAKECEPLSVPAKHEH